MNSSLKYSVQLLTEEQLTEAFEFRLKAYKVAYPKAIETIKHNFETDVYDVRSIHMGLFAEQDGRQVLAGYSRFVIPPCYEHLYSSYFIKNHPCYFLHKEFNYGNDKLCC